MAPWEHLKQLVEVVRMEHPEMQCRIESGHGGPGLLTPHSLHHSIEDIH